MNITLISLPSGQQIVGKILEEDDDTITLDAPITINLSNPMSLETAVYTSRYMPLAKNWTVTFHKFNIVSFSFIDDSLAPHYTSMVEYYRSRPYNYSSSREEQTPYEGADDLPEEEITNISNKTVH